MKQVKRFFRSSTGRVLLGVLMLAMLVCMGIATITMAGGPTRSTSAGGYELFRNSSPFGANFVIDKPRMWIPASGGTEVTATAIVGLGDGTPTPTEINTSEIGGFTFATTNSFSALVPLPVEIDLAEDIRIRALWTNSEAAATGTGLFTFYYEPFSVGTTAISVANDTCDTDGGVVVDLAAEVFTWSNWSTIDGGTIDLIPGQDFIGVKGKVTLDTIADMTGYGFQIEYARKWVGGGGAY